MTKVIEPIAFNERFTLYLNAEGKPVQRTLREMTAGEVLQAMEWQRAEAGRLKAETAPFGAWANAVEEGRLDDIPPDVSTEELEAAVAKCLEAADALERA